METKVLEAIKKYKLISHGDIVIAGLSGGADSVVLLHVLSSLKDKLGFRLRAVHVNHNIRGEEAERDRDFSLKLCEDIGIEIEIIEKDCPAYVKEHKLSLEESARALRYEAFREAYASEENRKIAVAHTVNDNAETMLMRMLRGTSSYGLRGMDIRHENIIRPLLFCTREEIEAYAAKNNLSFMTDSTNSDLNYTRNKIRGELIPHLKSEYNPNIIAALERLSISLKSDADYFGAATDAAFDKYVKTGPDRLIISKNAFVAEHEAVTSRLIRLCVKKLNGSDKDFDNVHMNLVSGLLNLKSGKRLKLSQGIEASNSFGDIAIYKPQAPIEEIPLTTCGLFKIDDCNYISVNEEKINCKENLANICTGVFIYDKITHGLTLRGRKNGDIIKLQTGKTVKLKDFLIQKGIPAFLRDTVYVVADGSTVLIVLSGINYIASDNNINQNKNLFIQLWRKNHG